MADTEKPRTEGPPESPTTARELDFDDDPQDTPASPQPTRPNTNTDTTTTTSARPGAGEGVAPPQPPRPMSPRQQAENTLKEAFPSIDAAVVRAVLTASGGHVEPAFNALLGMSDPDSQQEPPPPPQPPRPIQTSRGYQPRNQLEADELYARQLAEQYNSPTVYEPHPRSGSRGQREPHLPRPQRETGLKPNELYDDREHSFLDDDLPVIRDNIRKGFLETQSKVNSFITNLKKRIDGDDEEEAQSPPPRNNQSFGIGRTQQPSTARRSTEYGRRSADRERYDADHEVLGDDFTSLQLRDDSGITNESRSTFSAQKLTNLAPQRRSTRPLANPDLFNPSAPPPKPGTRRVSFQDGPPEDIDDFYRSSPDPTKRPLSSASRSKWQPLAAVEPDPVAEHDPFSLGDSDDEESKKKDLKADDAERLKKAAAEAMSDDLGSSTVGNGGDVKPHETVGSAGTRDKVAEEKLTGKP